jgi:putative ABC transport system permease protein
MDRLMEYLLAARLAAKDFARERSLSLCAVLALAAVLAPLLVLYGLKYGMVNEMTGRLQHDPRARELRSVGHGVYDGAFFAELARHPDTGFVVPATRFLAATVTLRNPAAPEREPVTVEVLPTAPGDPYLDGAALPAADAIVLGRAAADKLGAALGTALDARVGRRIDERDEAVGVPLAVAGVLPLTVSEREVGMIGLPLLLSIEDYREGVAVPGRGWTGKPAQPGPRRYSSFRLFAKDIDGVERLRDHLASLGIDTLTRIADIRMIQDLDRGLTALFLIVSGLGVTGYVLSLYASLWAMVERKRRDIATLRLVGFSTASVTLFPIVNALLTAGLGFVLAALIYRAVEPVLNGSLAAATHFDAAVAHLAPRHFALAAALTLFGALTAALAAGLKAGTVDPAEGMRDE